VLLDSDLLLEQPSEIVLADGLSYYTEFQF
jgi:hypothetical protein